MQELTPEQLVEKWDELIGIIKNKISTKRGEKLLELYEHFQDRILYCPASYKDYFHGAYPGGYLIHILNVIKYAQELDKLWSDGGALRDFTDEELIFSAINHDLGKIGDLEEPYYIEHNERWRKERGEIYMINPKIRYMAVPDRSVFLLNHFGITITQTELIAILLHDGMYDEGNKAYLQGYSEYKQLDDNLPIILHHADMMSMSIERDIWKSAQPGHTGVKSTKSKKEAKIMESDAVKKAAMDFFKKG